MLWTGPVYFGTSGYAYTSWKPAFYPAGVPARRFLEHYSRRLATVEINYTFTKLPTREQVASWLDAVPAGFRFSFKAPQLITHMRRLRNCHDDVTALLDVLDPVRKQDKLAALLFQLPPNFKADTERLDAFLAHPRLRRGTWPSAWEFRHESWFSADTYKVLERRGGALCSAEDSEFPAQIAAQAAGHSHISTAPLRYHRLRQDGGYTAAQRERLTARFRSTATRPTYVYLRHQDEPAGVLDALALQHAVSGTVAGAA